jgi:DNA polymerase III subunit delta
MPQLSLSRLFEHLRGRPGAAVVFLHGEEEYQREEAVQRILELFLDPATRDFNLDQLRGADAASETLASLIGTPPMMSEHRVVLVREAQGLSPKGREVIEAVLARPPGGIVLVLVASIPQGSKAKFYGVLKEKALATEFPPVSPLDLPGWLIERAASAHGLEIELAAARALAAAIGSQLGILAAELGKLADYVGDRKRVTVEDVEAVGGYVPRVDRWGWFDRIGGRDFPGALEEVPDLLDSGETAVGLVIGMGTHLLRLALLVAGGREGLDRQLKGNQRWLVNRLLPQAKKWSQAEIDTALVELLRTDRLLKTASLSDRQAIEELLLRLAGDSGSPVGLPHASGVVAHR